MLYCNPWVQITLAVQLDLWSLFWSGLKYVGWISLCSLVVVFLGISVRLFVVFGQVLHYGGKFQRFTWFSAWGPDSKCKCKCYGLQSSISIYILSLNFTFTPWPGFQNFFTQVICLSSLREHTTVLPQCSTHTKNPLAARYPLLLGGERHRQGDIQPGPKHCHLWESNPHRGDSLWLNDIELHVIWVPNKYTDDYNTTTNVLIVL